MSDGWRVQWTHIASGGQTLGEFWPDRESADYIAETIRRSPATTDVKVVPARSVSDNPKDQT